MKLRLATRRSPLALWQANEVARLLRVQHPDLEVELLPATTSADQRQDLSIAELGGKGAFAVGIQRLVLDGSADAAVHSAKDLPSETPKGLTLAAVPERGNPNDALVGTPLGRLDRGATVLTGSARRRVQLQALRPDLRFGELRGNIQTRLSKIPEGGAVVMAMAAIERLGLDGGLPPDTAPEAVVDPLDAEIMIPQVGQGAIAVECRADAPEVAAVLASIEHRASRIVLDAERSFLRELGGDCELPAGAFARHGAGGMLDLVGLLADPSGVPVHVERVTGLPDEAPGVRLARTLRAALEGA